MYLLFKTSNFYIRNKDLLAIRAFKKKTKKKKF